MAGRGVAPAGDRALAARLTPERIAVMQRGAIVEQGRHDELLAKGGRYAVFHQLQFGLREQS